ncbi:MAG: multi-sensor hybrid histidine kinase, partial [Thermoleophilia bacterium]|nr:multi-sensor hybrid histidine kinase [Thermoleophilia bacterium]
VLAGATLEQVGNLQVLRDLSQSLERRVSERTAQLARANEELDTSLAGQRAAFQQAREDARRLEEAIRIKDRFVSMVSHELRTPLTSIIGFSDTLRAASIDLTEEQRSEFLDIVQSQAHRLGRLVDELLTFSRIQRGAVLPRREETRLRPTIIDVIAELNLDAEVQVQCDPDVVISMSSDHVTQVLSNLLSNAERYGAPPFEVAAHMTSEFVELRVSDHGDGVEEDFVPLLFTEFTRDQRSPAANGPGFGLGLSIVVALAHTYGGDVSYEGVEPHGACFIVRIPTVDLVAEDDGALRQDE